MLMIVCTRRFCCCLSTPGWSGPFRTVSLSFNHSIVATKHVIPRMVFHRKMSIFRTDFRNEIGVVLLAKVSDFLVRFRIEGCFSGLAVCRVHANKRDMTEIPSPRQWCVRKTRCAAAAAAAGAAFPAAAELLVPFRTWHSQSGRAKEMGGAVARSET